MLLLFSIGFFIFFRKTSIFLFSFFLYFFATGPTFVVFAKNKTGADADMIRGDACLIHACVSARRKNRLWLGGAASRNGVYMRVHEYRKKPLPTTPQAIAIIYRRRIFRSPLGRRNARRGAYIAYVSTERFAADTAVGEKD